VGAGVGVFCREQLADQRLHFERGERVMHLDRRFAGQRRRERVEDLAGEKLGPFRAF
jgi:hypothetical protein